MATVAHPHHGLGGSDTGRRIWAIVGGSSGNLVEWFDFYVYSFTALYFASAFFPSGRPDDAAAQHGRRLRGGLPDAPDRRLALRPHRRQARPPHLDDDLGDR